VKKIPDGKTVFQFPHPQQYFAAQYEGLKPEEREILRRTDISIKLIALRKSQEK
jgi:hypothetical protein